MKDVLDAVDDGRLAGAFQNVHDAFEAQQIGAAMLGKRLEEEGERDGADRLLAQDRIGVDAVVGVSGVRMRVSGWGLCRSLHVFGNDRFNRGVIAPNCGRSSNPGFRLGHSQNAGVTRYLIFEPMMKSRKIQMIVIGRDRAMRTLIPPRLRGGITRSRAPGGVS